MNLKIYSLKITNYNDSSEPEVERYVRLNKKNLAFLKKECEAYWEDDNEDFSWDEGTYYGNGCKYWSWNDGDCCYAVVAEEIVYLNADKSSTQDTE